MTTAPKTVKELADQTTDVLAGTPGASAAGLVNVDGVARADHAEIDEAGRVFLKMTENINGPAENNTPRVEVVAIPPATPEK